MSSLNEPDPTVTEDELVIGESDVVEEVPPELVRVMAANSEELERLPGEFSVHVPGNKGPR